MLDFMSCWEEMLEGMAIAPKKGNALQPFWMYALGVGTMEPEELEELARFIGPEGMEAYVTAAEILHARGKAEGKAELIVHLVQLKSAYFLMLSGAKSWLQPLMVSTHGRDASSMLLASKSCPR